MPPVHESEVRDALRPDEPPAKAWRAVEAQHVVSTQRLIPADSADPAAEQDLLERIIEDAKPPLAPGTEGLHYLLATPFRYPPSPWGSRFRGPQDPGILYAAVARRTACAEMGYWRWRFVQSSDGLRELAASPQTVFQVGTRGPAIRLDAPPLNAHATTWTHPDDYTGTQALGRLARHAGAARVFYTSVRDQEGGTCIAVLDPAALKPRKPVALETWYLTIARSAVIWQRERDRFVFTFDQ